MFISPSHISWDIINQYSNNNLLSVEKHPEFNIYIIDVTIKVKYNNFKDEITDICRGIVIDSDGKIISRTFNRIQNIEEIDREEITKLKDFDVLEKIDGYYFKVFCYNDNWIYCSRNSFINKVATTGWSLFKKSIFLLLDKRNSYIFELFDSSLKLVINYDKPKLTLISVINNESEFEYLHEDLKEFYGDILNVVRKFKNIKNINDLITENSLSGIEGYVVMLVGGRRIKIKSPEYSFLKCFYSNLSTYNIWFSLKSNHNLNNIIKHADKEERIWILNHIIKFNKKFKKIEGKVYKEFYKLYHIKSLNNKIDFANEIENNQYRTLLFNLYDKIDINQIIWDKLKPKTIRYFSE